MGTGPVDGSFRAGATLPTATQPSERTKASVGDYTVVKNDTLSKLAKEAYGDASKWTLIRDANPKAVKMRGDVPIIQIDAKLKIPELPSGWSAVGAPPRQRPVQETAPAEATTTVQPQGPLNAGHVYVHAKKNLDALSAQVKGLPAFHRDELMKTLEAGTPPPAHLRAAVAAATKFENDLIELVRPLPASERANVAALLDRDIAGMPAAGEAIEAMNRRGEVGGPPEAALTRDTERLDVLMRTLEAAGESPTPALLADLQVTSASVKARTTLRELGQVQGPLRELTQPVGAAIERELATLHQLQQQIAAGGENVPVAMQARVQTAMGRLETAHGLAASLRELAGQNGGTIDAGRLGQLKALVEAAVLGAPEALSGIKAEIAAGAASERTRAAIGRLVGPADQALARDRERLGQLQHQLENAGENPNPALLTNWQIATAREKATAGLQAMVFDFAARRGGALGAEALNELQGQVEAGLLHGDTKALSSLMSRIASDGAAPGAAPALRALVEPAGTAVARGLAHLSRLQQQLAVVSENPPPALLARIQIATARLQTAVDLQGRVRDLVARPDTKLPPQALAELKRQLDAAVDGSGQAPIYI